MVFQHKDLAGGLRKMNDICRGRIFQGIICIEIYKILSYRSYAIYSTSIHDGNVCSMSMK